MFEVKSGTLMATFTMPGPLQSLCFSENGTWLGASSQGQTSVSIWDLRKSAQTKTLETGGRVDCLAWDWTGQFLVTGGPAGLTVQKYSKAEKEWSEPLRVAVPAVGVEWGSKAKSLVTVNGEGVITVVGGNP
jgi:pre-mRNA-processing factor 19